MLVWCTDAAYNRRLTGGCLQKQWTTWNEHRNLLCMGITMKSAAKPGSGIMNDGSVYWKGSLGCGFLLVIVHWSEIYNCMKAMML